MRSRNGFSRLEVVLCLLAVSVGFGLLYVANKPRVEQRNRSTCQSNLKQIGLAMLVYAQDSDDTLPRAWSGRNAGPSDAGTNYKWMDAIYPYLKDREIHGCPSDASYAEYTFRSTTNYGSYVINNAYFAKGDNLTPPGGQRLSRMVSPTLVLLVTDGVGDFQLAWPNERSAPTWTTTTPRRLDSIIERHTGKANTLFCDGHVSYYSSRQIFGQQNFRGRKIYNWLTIESD